ncbi:hypothetical protein BpHYR1_026383 [Brachionus plicatilis]|uniref:Uncharacterized protein n=1 Tax=Brachionus plicatilis TaxID=10195 RepID=A0A3M7SVK9_BRAPC|nr:hypothetical protein BpHYR1_026383 [Brachionus plicatilis]
MYHGPLNFDYKSIKSKLPLRKAAMLVQRIKEKLKSRVSAMDYGKKKNLPYVVTIDLFIICMVIFDTMQFPNKRTKISHGLKDITLLICIHSESAQSHLQNGAIDILAKNVY